MDKNYETQSHYFETVLAPNFITHRIGNITISDTKDTYGGAHTYHLRECVGFRDGETVFTDDWQTIQFVKKNEDGIVAGITNEQLYLMLIDRLEKLNSRFPCTENDLQIQNLKANIRLCEQRVKDRIDRKVMGELKD